ncbi:hypothetical protein JXA12_02835 [Candidatus Woesearchaeota archaeon]|nr:hypothetical protein [Candidatus Woesearchaeota archaeon]
MDSKKRVYKSISDLIVTEEFKIAHILTESQIVHQSIKIVSLDHNGETIGQDGKRFDDIYGDMITVQNIQCGMITKYILDVVPAKKTVPIKKLVFEGFYSPITLEQKIQVKLFKGEKDIEKQKQIRLGYFDDRSKNNEIYFERNFYDVELALEIINYNNDKLISNSRSIYYKDYFKDSLF